MRRTIFTGCGFEVLHATAPGEPGGPPVDVRILRFVDDGAILDFPLSMEDWEQLKQMGDSKDSDPLNGFEVVKAMPGVLRDPPPPRPPR
jgi:hypothetical protein